MIAKTSMLLASVSLSIGMAGAPAQADEKAAAAVVALGLIGIAAMAHNDDHYRDGYTPQTPEATADFERGYRDGLHNEPYDSDRSSVDYGAGYDAGHKERANRLAYKHESAGVKVPNLAARGCVGEASAKWGRDPRDIHVVAAKEGTFSEAAGQEYKVEVAAGHKHGHCDVNAQGTVFKFHKGRL